MAETQYTPRLTRPGIAIERGRDQVITCPVYSGSTIAAPSAGSTCRVSSPAGVVVHSAAVSIVDSVAEATLLTADFAPHVYSDGWHVEWALTMPDSAVHTFREVGALCRTGSQRRITPLDIYRLEPYLDPTERGAVWSQTGEEQCIEAWLELEHRLWSAGNRPWLVVNQPALRQVELYVALRMCYEALVSANRAAWSDKLERATTSIDRAWAAVTLSYDYDGQARVDGSGVPARSSGWWTSTKRAARGNISDPGWPY